MREGKGKRKSKRDQGSLNDRRRYCMRRGKGERRGKGKGKGREGKM